ncbi:hypothetical protein D3C76_1110830 [compost metagenome]
MQGYVYFLLLHLLQLAAVIGHRTTRCQSHAIDIRLRAWCFADVHAEGDPRTDQQLAHPLQLVFGKGVHGVNDHRRYPRLGAIITQL